MNFEPLHLQVNRLNRNSTVLLLLIPSIVFVIVLGLTISHLRNIEVANSNQSSVLGGEESK